MFSDDDPPRKSGDPEAEVARIERLSDEELLAEAAAAGVDVPTEAARVRRVLTEAVQHLKGELFRVGDPQPFARHQAFRPRRVECSPSPEPYVCPPLRLFDCPACGALPGIRCDGIDRDDEVHAERHQVSIDDDVIDFSDIDLCEVCKGPCQGH